jgi:hypothetical protein
VVLVHFFDERKFFLFAFVTSKKKHVQVFFPFLLPFFTNTPFWRSKNLNSPLLGERCIVSYIIKKTRNTLSSLVLLLTESPS